VSIYIETSAKHENFPAMSHSYSQILIHLVFSTKYRLPHLSNSFRMDLHEFIKQLLIQQFDSKILVSGSVEDHMHHLIALSPKDSLSEIVMDIKKESSKWIKLREDYPQFSWKKGYYACSVWHGEKQHVIDYILNQENHHKKSNYRKLYNSVQSYLININRLNLEISQGLSDNDSTSSVL